MSHSVFPPEILLNIAECVVPSTITRPIALPPSHVTTKTLLSLTLTSRLLYPTALRLLYAHCLYLDSFHRLQCLVQTLIGHDHQALSTRPRSLPPTHPSHHITALYLSPFPTDIIDDLRTANEILSLFTLLAPHLRRLVIDIPLRSLHQVIIPYPICSILQRAFSQLEELEEFCSVRDELYLDIIDLSPPVGHQPIWTLWHKLKTLSLYNPDVSADRYWSYLGKLPNLQVLTLTRSDGLDMVDIKSEWEKNCGGKNRPLSVVLVNVDSHHQKPLESEPWGTQHLFEVRQVNVSISYYGDEDEAELCQEFVKRKVLKGESPVCWT